MHSRAYSFEPIALIFGMCINHRKIWTPVDFGHVRARGGGGGGCEISCVHSRAYNFEPIALIFGMCINHGKIWNPIDFGHFRTRGEGGGGARFLVCTLELRVLNRLL